ncbi:HTTM domain-containing protein [Tautonia plasticadhaerens]|uniref:Vitamin K-dependent gamma-carboxylase n=1 Tax=Tautonia plasticadhaerens TaxID=2527974 RepID=A0A518HDL2_9BACT|nr:HTTM domain-containing protein [Tautonia plasticadhaerens]QDV38947.1 Vitamin K-dependent gamma-carboxylase [Tautonia plasticadhaerens]
MLNRIDRWIFHGYPARVGDLAVLRVMYASYMILGQFPRATWILDSPSAFFAPPPGPAAMFTDWPADGVILGLNWAYLLGLVALLIGWRTPIASLVSGVVFIALGCWTHASVKINHDILLGVLPLAMAASGWGRWWSLDARRPGSSPGEPARGWCLSLLALMIGAAMATAGWAKFSTGWLDTTTHSTYGYLTSQFVRGEAGPLAEVVLTSRPEWLHELGDWAAVWLELGFLAATFWRPAFRWCLGLAVVFHLGNWLLFDIHFGSNVVVYGAFVPWSRLVPPSWLSRTPRPSTLGVGGLLAFGYGAWMMLAEPLLLWSSRANSSSIVLDRVVILIGTAIAALFFARSLGRLVSPAREGPGRSTLGNP